jgi:predicted nucleic acid-binding protein
MRIYLDVSCLNRPFDDQSQLRIAHEADAVQFILEHCELYGWELVPSQMAVQEIEAIEDVVRRDKVKEFLPYPDAIIGLDDNILDRAEVIADYGIKEADAIHLAAAEAIDAGYLLTCDDKLLKRAQKLVKILEVLVWNPLNWLELVHEGI